MIWAYFFLSVVARTASGQETLSASIASPARHELPDATTRWKRECGINGLYLFLNLSGHEVDYSRVRQSTPVGPRGSTMLQLRDAARSLGANVSVYALTRQQLQSSSKPVLVYLRESPFVPAEAGLPSGHYVVVLDTSPKAVHFLDSSFARQYTTSWERFERRWVGHVLAFNPKSVTWRGLGTFAGLGASVGVACAVWQSFRCRGKIRNCNGKPTVSAKTANGANSSPQQHVSAE
jgi:hypothetical protein